MAAVLTLSPYKIGIFRQCPRRYKYHYLDGMYEQCRRWWPFYTMGAHVHTALSHFLSPLNKDRSLPRLERYLRESWVRQRRGFETPEEERLYYTRARSQLRWFYAHEDVEARPHMIEALHSATLAPGLRLTGKVDRIDRDDEGAFRVVDYKTGKSAASGDDLQLRAYALLLSRRYRVEVSEVSYLYLNGDGLIGHVPSEYDLSRTQTEILAVGAAITAERDFAPCPGPLCAWCDFQELCQETALDGFGEPPEVEPWD